MPRQVGAVRDAGARPAARHARAQSRMPPTSSASSSRATRSPSRSPISSADVLRACRCRSASTGSRRRSSPTSSRTASGAASPMPGLRSTAMSGVCVGLPGVVERAAGRLPPEPDLPRARRAARPRAVGAPRRAGDRRQRRQPDHARRALVRSRPRPRRFPGGRVEHTLGLGIMHDGELFRGANGLSPDLGDLIVRLRRDGAARPLRRSRRDRDPGRRRCCLGGDARRRARDERRGRPRWPTETSLSRRSWRRGARRRHRQPHHAVRAAEGDPRRRRPGGSANCCIAPLRAAVAEVTPPSLADVSEIVVHQSERRQLGARRGGHDAARPLRRALEHDRPGAAR